MILYTYMQMRTHFKEKFCVMKWLNYIAHYFIINLPEIYRIFQEKNKINIISILSLIDFYFFEVIEPDN